MSMENSIEYTPEQSKYIALKEWSESLDPKLTQRQALIMANKRLIDGSFRLRGDAGCWIIPRNAADPRVVRYDANGEVRAGKGAVEQSSFVSLKQWGESLSPKITQRRALNLANQGRIERSWRLSGQKGPWVIPVDAPDCRIMKHHL